MDIFINNNSSYFEKVLKKPPKYVLKEEISN